MQITFFSGNINFVVNGVETRKLESIPQFAAKSGELTDFRLDLKGRSYSTQAYVLYMYVCTT